jgi:PIN domain nuclease of toxin-antitoxin system
VGGGTIVLVLDTHVVVWKSLAPERISLHARRELSSAEKEEGLIISDITFWEIAMLINKKRLVLPVSYLEFIHLIRLSTTYRVQPITPEIAELSTHIDPHINADPADRLISATALIMSAPLVTADTNLRNIESIPTIW